MLTINSNNAAQKAQIENANALREVEQASARLTTGVRINRAADDVANSGLAARMNKTSIQTAQYIENSANGISMIQTADAALKQNLDMITRMQELAYQAENSTVSDEDRALIQAEFEQVAMELARNTSASEYNGQKLLDGTWDGTIVVGEGAENQIGVGVGADGALGAALDAIVIDNGDGTYDVQIDLTAITDWQTEVHDLLDAYAKEVITSRSDLGAVQNRLEFTTASLQEYKMNIDSSLSLIQDTDYALETTNLAKANVRASASQSMLAQANRNMEDAVSKLLP